jgi:hypothetical protein
VNVKYLPFGLPWVAALVSVVESDEHEASADSLSNDKRIGPFQEAGSVQALFGKVSPG